jgi:hypothetical protein
MVLTIPLLILLAGCTHTIQSQQPASADPGTITFVAADYRYDGPERISSGKTIIRMHNEGREAHHIQLVKLERGYTLPELIEMLQGPIIRIPASVTQIGGPNAVGSGADAEALVYLDPGRYALICVMPTREGTPHAVLGMHKKLEVVDRSSSSSSDSGFLPSDYHLVMADYEFTMLEKVVAGRHTFRVVNRGSHAHEASLIRLAPRATVGDVLASFALGTAKALPGTLLGGVSGLDPGREGIFTATLSPGRYGLFCLFPNPHHETSHVRRGMVMTFTVD